VLQALILPVSAQSSTGSDWVSKPLAVNLRNPAYDLSSIYVADVSGNGVINIGDVLRLANNVSYPGIRHIY